jgi:phage replication-related protein YjqB (UPF0714/DUF867 family)
MADMFKNYAELSQAYTEGTDYKITYAKNSTEMGVFAFHGGGIELGTTELLELFKSKRPSWSWYSFEALLSSNNVNLHITSTNFDEPRAINLVDSLSRAVSLHGADGDTPITYIGGLDQVMRDFIWDSLERRGFAVQLADGGIAGKEPNNIINRPSHGGVQLEMSTQQRKEFFTNNDWSKSNRTNPANWTQKMKDYTDAVIEGVERALALKLLASGQLSLTDLNDAIVAGTPPANPTVGTLWIDSSVEPAMLKKWNGTSWDDMGELDPNLSETISDIQETLGNMANDGILNFQERQVIKDKITEIIGYVPYDRTPFLSNYKNKTSGSTSANAHIAKYYSGTTAQNPKTAGTEFAQSSYDAIKTLNNTTSQVGNVNVSGQSAYQIYGFNLINIVEDRFGKIPAGTTADKVAWLKDNIYQFKLNWTGRGASATGNKVSLANWREDVGSWGTAITHTNGTLTNISNTVDVSIVTYRIDSNGFTWFMANADASDGTTQSVVLTDYLELEVIMKSPLPSYSILDNLGYGDLYNVRKSAILSGISTTDSKYTAVGTAYSALETYLEGLTPINAWDTTDVNKDEVLSVDKTTFRDKWLNYYTAVSELATATADQLKQNVDNVVVGGTNWARNGDFRIDLTKSAWSNTYVGNTVEVVDISTEKPPFMKALHVKNTSATNGGIFQPVIWDGEGAGALANREITVSFWLKHQNITMGASDWMKGRFGEIIVQGRKADGTFVYSYLLATKGYITGTDMDWKKWEGTIKIPVPPGAEKVTRISFKHGIENCTGEFWTTGIKVEIGNKATDWSPCPLDLEDRISKAEFKVTDSEIVSTVTGSSTYQANINTINQSISNVSKKIDDVSIGGRNFLRYTGDFSKGWSAFQNIANVIVIDDTRFGKVLQATTDSGTTARSPALKNDIMVDVVGGQEMTLSFWIKRETAGTITNLFKFRDANNAESNPVVGTDVNVSANTWYYYTQTFKVPATAVKLYITARIATSEASKKFWLAQPKLENGNKATDWTLALEDTAESIQATQAQIDDMMSDLKVTPIEKSSLKTIWDNIKYEQAQLSVQADALGVSRTAYNTAYSNLNGTSPKIEAEVLASMTTTYTFGSTTLRDTFKTQMNIYNNEAQKLRKAITDKVNANAKTAQDTIDNLVVGGTNIVQYSGNFKDTTGWSVNGSSGTLIEKVVVDGFDVLHGKGSIAGSLLDVTNILKPNTEYMFSMEIKLATAITNATDNQPAHFWLGTTAGGNHDAKASLTLMTPTSIPANTWTRVIVKLKTKAVLPTGTINFKPFVYGLASNTSEFWLKNVQFEEGNRATAWGLSPEEVQQRISDVKIGVRNLLTKTAFKDDTHGLGSNVGTSVTTTLAIASESTSPSGKALTLTRTDTSTNSGGRYWNMSGKLTGTEYTWSVWVKGSGLWSIGSEQGGQRDITLTDTWTYVTHTFNPNNSSYYQFTFYRKAGSTGGSITFHSLKLEEGNKATTWNLAQEDIDSYISSVETTANNAKSAIADMSSDSKVTPVEKTQLKKEWATIQAEKPTYEALANTYGITTEKTNYVNAYNALNTAITPILSNLTTTTDVNGATFRNTFDDYYDKMARLNRAINEKAKTLADTAQRDIDNLEIGAINLMSGTEFKDTTGYYAWQSVGTLSAVTQDNFTGFNYLKLDTKDSSGANLTLASGTSLAVQPSGRKFAVKANEKYTVSFLVATSELGNTLDYMYLMHSDGNGNMGLPTVTITNFPSVKPAWSGATSNYYYYRVFFTFTADRDDESAYVMIGGRTAKALDSSAYAWIRLSQLKVEKGNRATAWSPSVEDVNTYIGSVESTANQAKSDIADMSSDSKITPIEKVQLKKEWATITAEKTTYYNMGTTFGATAQRDAYNTSYNNLNTLLNGSGGVLTNMSTTSTVNATTFRATFDDYYDKLAILIRTTSEKAKTLADTAQTTANDLKNNIVPAIATRVTTVENRTTDGAIINTVTSSTKWGDKANTSDVFTKDEIAQMSTSQLLHNTEFATGTDGWNLTTGWSLDTSTRFEGVNSLKVDVSGLTADAWRACYSEYYLPPNGLSLEGRAFTGSFYVYTTNLSTDDGNRGWNMEIEWFNSTGTRIGTHSATIKPTAINTWQRFSKTGIAPAGTAKARLRAHPTRNGAFWIAKPMLQMGSVLGAWSPSIDELATDLSSRISQTNGRVDIVVTSDNKINGQAIASSITATPNAIKLISDNINLTGKVTFDSFANSAKDIVANLGQIININPYFIDWSGTYPSGYSGANINSGASMTKTTETGQKGNLLKYATTSAGLNAYLQPSQITNYPFFNYITVTATFKLESGGLDGAGVLFRYCTSSGQSDVFIKFSDLVPSPTLNKWYTVTKTLYRSSAPSGFTGYQVYPMGSWTSFATNASAKVIYFSEVSARPSSDVEILSYQNDGIIADNKSVWDRASAINSNGTVNSSKLTGTISENLLANASDWNWAKGKIDLWKYSADTTKVNGGVIATNTIFAQSLLLSDWTNLCENPEFETDTAGVFPNGYVPSYESKRGATRVKDITSYAGGNGSSKALEMDAFSGDTNSIYSTNIIPVTQGQSFFVEGMARYLNTAGSGYGRIGFRRYDATRTAISSWDTVVAWTGAKGVTFSSKNGTYTVPSGCSYIQLWISFSDNKETTNKFYLDNIRVHRMANAELIVDGTITAGHIKSLNGLNVGNGQFTVDANGNVKLGAGAVLEAVQINSSRFESLRGNTFYLGEAGAKIDYSNAGGIQRTRYATNDLTYLAVDDTPVFNFVMNGSFDVTLKPYGQHYGLKLGSPIIKGLVGNDTVQIRNWNDTDYGGIATKDATVTGTLNVWGNQTLQGVTTITGSTGGLMKMIGTGDAYIEMFPDGSGAGRKSFFGHETATGNNFVIQSDSDEIILKTNATRVKVDNGVSRVDFKDQNDNGWADIYVKSSNNQSRRELKKNIEPMTKSALREILKTVVSQYHYKNESDESKKHTGIIVDEAPYDVVDDREEGIDIYASSIYSWKAIQELYEELYGEIHKLQTKIKRLEGRKK